MAREYVVKRGGIHDRFLNSRAKLRLFGGGFGNGKTAAACILAIKLAREYPGSNGLIARSTYPKLNDTIRKEFFKWCDPSWIKSNPKNENTCTLTNGTTINFRYVSQKSSNGETSTSNLLSATYDWIIVDQIEDPEIEYKDFTDLLGRLRGMTVYQGDDPTMPKTGPRWFIALCNPTTNWVYRKLVRPIKLFQATGERHPDLIVDPRTLLPMMDIIEGSTYENAHNLELDYIETLEATYKGQDKDRYLGGKWAAYEGLVFPQFDQTFHVIPNSVCERYLRELLLRGMKIEIVEGYDYGIAKPSCYLLGVTDHLGNTTLIDGFHKAEASVSWQAEQIKMKRAQHGLQPSRPIYGDPAIFRRTAGDAKVVGKTISGLFQDEGIMMQRGNNDIASGIEKCKTYITLDMHRRNPYSKTVPGTRIYISDALTFFTDEILDYFWKTNSSGERQDVPRDKNDHAMNAWKYLMSHKPKLAIKPTKLEDRKEFSTWGEIETDDRHANSRYA